MAPPLAAEQGAIACTDKHVGLGSKADIVARDREGPFSADSGHAGARGGSLTPFSRRDHGLSGVTWNESISPEPLPKAVGTEIR